MKLSIEAYRDSNPPRIARFFLGKFLLTRTSEGISGGMILETEAYGGAEDKACHGYNNRRTARTEIMFAPGGHAYVYLCYGMHQMFNIVTGPQDVPQAVLVRSVLITDGQALVTQRRHGVPSKNWSNGPGRVTSALGIGRHHNTRDLTGDRIWLEDRGVVVPQKEIVRTPRIGIDYAGEWVKKPWRFVWQPNADIIGSLSVPANINQGQTGVQ